MPKYVYNKILSEILLAIFVKQICTIYNKTWNVPNGRNS